MDAGRGKKEEGGWGVRGLDWLEREELVAASSSLNYS